MKNILISIWFVSLILLSGCSQELELFTPPVSIEKKVNISFTANPTRFLTPSTRAGVAQEDEMGTSLWVYVFEGTSSLDKKLALIEKADISSRGEVSLLLEPTDKPVTIVLLANAPETYLDKNRNVQRFEDISMEGYTSYNELQEELNTSLLDSPRHATVPYSEGGSIPMSGEITLPGGIPDANMQLGTVMLRRIVAKITIENQADGFELEGATAGNVPRSGFFLTPHSVLKNNTGYLTHYIAAGGTNEVSGIAVAISGNDAVKQTTQPNPIYVYESRSEEGTFVIVKGSYQGKPSTYYKLDMLHPYSDSEGTTYPANLYKRNFAYKFIINSIAGNGYATLSEAISGVPANNISAAVDVVDLSSHDIIDNGEYYLGVTNSELWLQTEEAVNEILVSRITYNGPISNYKFVIASFEGTSPIIQPTSTSEELLMVFPVGFLSCKVTLQFGNLTRTISIFRKPVIPADGEIITEFYSSEHVHGKVDSNTNWLGFSTSNNPDSYLFRELSNDKNNFYLIVRPNTSGSRREAILYVSRNNKEGRLKIYIAQV